MSTKRSAKDKVSKASDQQRPEVDSVQQCESAKGAQDRTQPLDPQEAITAAFAGFHGIDIESFIQLFAPPGTPSVQQIVNGRQVAIAAIQVITSFAKTGDELALQALYKIAFLATSELEDQAVRHKKQIAPSVFGWPVILSSDKAWNKYYLEREFYTLGLSREVEPMVRAEAVVTKGNLLKETTARILALIAGWRTEEMHRSLVADAGPRMRAAGLGEAGAVYAQNRHLEELREEEQRTAQKLQALALLLKADLSSAQPRLAPLRNQGIQLPQLPNTRKVQSEWFRVLMGVLEAMTDSRYELKRHRLRQWGGIPFTDVQTDIDLQGDLRQNIRDQMKKVFHRMLTDHV